MINILKDIIASLLIVGSSHSVTTGHPFGKSTLHLLSTELGSLSQSLQVKLGTPFAIIGSTNRRHFVALFISHKWSPNLLYSDLQIDNPIASVALVRWSSVGHPVALLLSFADTRPPFLHSSIFGWEKPPDILVISSFIRFSLMGWNKMNQTWDKMGEDKNTVWTG